MPDAPDSARIITTAPRHDGMLLDIRLAFETTQEFRMRNQTMLTVAITLSALGLGALATAAFADPSPGWWRGHHGGGGGGGFGMMRDLMQRYDANKDGKVTQEEIDANRTEWHARFDTNKNGSLDLKEFEALWLEANRQRMVREFQRLDPNGDGTVTLDEYKDPLSRIVADRDRNNDGALSRDDRRRWDRDGDGDRRPDQQPDQQ
jgi:Ca2+-binding EF-hand superfamily protein